MEEEKTKCSNCGIEEVVLADSSDRVGRSALQNYGLSPSGSKRILLKKCPKCEKLNFYLK